MKKILLTLSLFAFSTALMAQDDINLLDLVVDTATITTTTTTTTTAEPYEPIAPADDYDWRAHRHSLSVSVGTPSFVSMMVGGFSGVFNSFEEGGGHTVIYGSYGLHYGFNALKWLRVGGTLLYNGYKTTEYQSNGHEHTTHFDEIIILGRVDFTYLNRPKVRLYSGLGAGIDLSMDRHFCNGEIQPNEDGETTNLIQPFASWNVTVFGAEFGGERVFGLAELNWGFADVLRVGLGVRF